MGEDLMKRFLLLLALIATTGGALAHEQDPELQRAHRQCKRGLYQELLDLDLPTSAKAVYWDCMKARGYVRKD